MNEKCKTCGEPDVFYHRSGEVRSHISAWGHPFNEPWPEWVERMRAAAYGVVPVDLDGAIEEAVSSTRYYREACGCVEVVDLESRSTEWVPCAVHATDDDYPTTATSCPACDDDDAPCALCNKAFRVTQKGEQA